MLGVSGTLKIPQAFVRGQVAADSRRREPCSVHTSGGRKAEAASSLVRLRQNLRLLNADSGVPSTPRPDTITHAGLQGQNPRGPGQGA